jgi:hypothetical protein
MCRLEYLAVWNPLPLPVLDLPLVEPLLSGAGLFASLASARPLVPCVARGAVSAVVWAVVLAVLEGGGGLTGAGLLAEPNTIASLFATVVVVCNGGTVVHMS